MYGRGSINSTIVTRPRHAPSPFAPPTRTAWLGEAGGGSGLRESAAETRRTNREHASTGDYYIYVWAFNRQCLVHQDLWKNSLSCGLKVGGFISCSLKVGGFGPVNPGPFVQFAHTSTHTPLLLLSLGTFIRGMCLSLCLLEIADVHAQAFTSAPVHDSTSPSPAHPNPPHATRTRSEHGWRVARLSNLGRRGGAHRLTNKCICMY